MPAPPEGQKPKCKLVGTDGNAFSVIGKVTQALTEAGFIAEAKEFVEKSWEAGSYDALLRLAMEYTDVG